MTVLDYKNSNGENVVSSCDKDLCEGNNETKAYCGCHWVDEKCKVPRSEQEVCTQISEYYNPLYIKGKLQNSGKNVLDCDDIVGGRIGEFHCLGITIIILRVFYIILIMFMLKTVR